jgi:hypothetical protein
MADSLTKFVCGTEELAAEAKGELMGDGYTIIFGPEHVNYGTTDMTKSGGVNHPYAGAWVVIGKK